MGLYLHWNLLLILKFSDWVLNCKNVVQNILLENEISVVVPTRCKVVLCKFSGSLMSFNEYVRLKLPQGCTR